MLKCLMATSDITRLLISARERGPEGLNELLPLVYDELRAMAHRAHSRGDRSDTLNTTALVHETYIKLHASESLTLQDRRHFLAVAAMAMRQLIVDHARRRSTEKRGGGARHVNLDDTVVVVEDYPDEILVLEDSLARLAALEPRLGRLVELRFFAGLTVDETAEVLELDPRTVRRDWRKARAILYRALQGDPDSWQAGNTT
jgi:RNA polymerase sigma factor (TIGR02999 family)